MSSTRQYNPGRADLAGDLRHTLEREERRRHLIVRVAIAVGILGIIGVMAAAGMAMRSSLSPSAASSSVSSLDLAAAQATQVKPSATKAASEPKAKPASKASKPAAAKSPAPKSPALKPAAEAALTPAAKSVNPVASAVVAPQRFRIALAGSGYQPSRITASSKSSITLSVGKGQGCAAGFTIAQLGVNANNSAGSVTIKLGKLKPGTYMYACSMGMVTGQLVVH